MATKIARAMVTEYGMSAKLGAVRYGQEGGDPFLGRSMGVQSDYSHEIAREIDEEVRNLIEQRTPKRGQSSTSTAMRSTSSLPNCSSVRR